MPVLEHAQSIVLEFEQQVLHKQHLHQNPYGAVAQLGERVVRNDEVGSSILLGSTTDTRLLLLSPGSSAG